MHQRHVPSTRCRTVQATQCQCTAGASSTTSSQAGQITGTPAPSQRRGGEDSEGYSSESSMGEGRGEREYQREMDLILRQLRGVRRTRRGEFSVKSA